MARPKHEAPAPAASASPYPTAASMRDKTIAAHAQELGPVLDTAMHEIELAATEGMLAIVFDIPKERAALRLVLMAALERLGYKVETIRNASGMLQLKVTW
jgi:hypothetical protein